MMNKSRIALVALLAFSASGVYAAPIDNTASQYKPTNGTPGSVSGIVVQQSADGYNTQPVNSAHPLPVTLAGGGGSATVNQGTKGTAAQAWFMTMTDGAGNITGTINLPFYVQGPAASGAAVAGNPVLIGGSDGTNARAVKTATDGTLLGFSASIAGGDGRSNTAVSEADASSNPVEHWVRNYMYNGATWDRARSGTATGSMLVNNGTAANLLTTASQGGTWNVTNVSGTISLPTGASTSALQPTNAAQGSTTSGQTGPLVQGAVTTAAPSYTTAQTSPLSLTTAGSLRVTGGTGTSTAFADATSNTQNLNNIDQEFAMLWNGATWDRQPGSTLGAFMQGNVARGVAPTANPLLVGGRGRSSSPSQVANDQAVDLWLNLAGAMVSAPTTTTAPVDANTGGSFMNLQNSAASVPSVNLYGYNGATYDRLRTATIGNGVAATGLVADAPYVQFNTVLPTLTNGQYGSMQADSSGRPIVVGAGTAGAATGGVVSIQGVASGTAVPVSGTVTATNTANGTTGAAAPAAATQIGGTDGANLQPAGMVVGDSGQNAQVVSGARKECAVGAGTGFFCSIDASNYRYVSVQITAGGSNSQLQISNDNSNWTTLPVYSTSSNINQSQTTISGVGTFVASIPARFIRINNVSTATGVMEVFSTGMPNTFQTTNNRVVGNIGGIFDAATGAAVPVNAIQMGISDNTNLVAPRTITGTVAAGTGTAAVAVQPTSSANQGMASTKSGAAESNHVLKGSAGNLFNLTTTIGATSGYLMIFNATSAPVDGAVTPDYCAPINSNGTNGALGLAWNNFPLVFGTGITAVFSTTGCYTKTASATAAFFAQVQ